MNRKPVVGISLKMYQNKVNAAKDYAAQVASRTGKEEFVEQFFCPGMGVIYPVSRELADSTIGLGAQNIGPEKNGAYTGEFSIESLLDMEGKYVEIGHCERREYFAETDQMINEKVKMVLNEGLTPVLCIGEKDNKDFEQVKHFLHQQLFMDLGFIPENQLKKVIIAYEPVWAVGKTLAANAPYVHEAHKSIREIVKELFSEEVASHIRIIYGGSVSQENVELIVSDENVDGVFVGRFGHEPDRYQKIVELVKKVKGGC